nr:3409_t:CDS:2 [Entrophospora candida]
MPYTKDSEFTIYRIKLDKSKSKQDETTIVDLLKNRLKTDNDGVYNINLEVDTTQKPFSDWTFSLMAELFERKPIKSNSDEEKAFEYLFEELKVRTKVIKLTSGSSEKACSHIIFSFLAVASSLYNGDFEIKCEYRIEGTHGRGPLDFAILYLDEMIAGVSESKKSDIEKGVGQNAVQLQASIETNLQQFKRQESTNHTDGGTPKTIFGIVSNAEKWRTLKLVFDSKKENPEIAISNEEIPFELPFQMYLGYEKHNKKFKIE